jgi:hypothetical protein
VRTDLGQPALGCIPETIEDRAGDRQLEDAVAEKLEALVGGGTVVCPRRVSEDLREPVCGKLVDQAAELRRSGLLLLATPGVR